MVIWPHGMNTNQAKMLPKGKNCTNPHLLPLGKRKPEHQFKKKFFFPFVFISWRLITLQYCSAFCHTLTWVSHGFMCVPHPDPPSPSHPSRSSQCTRSEHLSHASNLGWRSVSRLMIYMFRCCSLETSHPRLLPQSPKVCSVHLCLFFCFAYRVIVTIFLNSLHMR